MKILYSTKNYLPNYRAGDSVNAHEIHKWLVSRGHQVIVMRGMLQQPYFIDGISVQPRQSTLYHWADIVTTALDFTQATIEDVGHEKPIAFYMHNTFYETTLNRNPHVSIVYNNPVAQRDGNYTNDGYVLTPPVDPLHYEVQRPDAEYITLINCNKNKGAQMLAKIAEALPDMKFLAVLGDYGAQEPPIAPNVTVWPIQDNIREVYKVTRLLLMPSTYESWGRTATEAACSGIPVLCTDTWGLRENLGDNGIYCSNLAEYINAIESLKEKENYDKASEKIRKVVVNPTKKMEGLEAFFAKKIQDHKKKIDYGVQPSN